MEEMKDYSGKFNPNLNYTEFSKDALVQMWREAGKLYIGIDGIWYTLIKERFGEKVAMELEEEVWRRCTKLEAQRSAEAVNIKGNDVEALFKTLQVDSGNIGMGNDVEFELKNSNHGIMTIKRCAALDYFEKHDYPEEAVKWMCHTVDGVAFEEYADFFNPKIKVIPLFLPPRKNTDKIACQVEFKLEE